MKKLLTLLTICSLEFSFIPQVFAMTEGVMQQTASNSPKLNPTREAIKATITEDRITHLNQRADKEITRRITSLTNLVNRINSIPRLTPTQKANFASQIQNEITSLTTLKAKIDADTDLQTLRTDVQSIVQSYRVYALYMPQIEIVMAADRMLDLNSVFGTLEAKLQTRITQAQTAGNNVSALQTTYTDLVAKLNDATTQTQNAINAVIALTPQGYPGNKTTLMSARTMLKTARQDIEAAYKDARTIIEGLKAFKPKPSPNISGAPTSSSSGI